LCAKTCCTAQRGGENVPSYVLEYLLGKYCASDDEDEIGFGIDAVKDTLTRNYFRHDEANKAEAPRTIRVVGFFFNVPLNCWVLGFGVRGSSAR